MGQVAEGVKTVHAAVELADRYGLPMPITRTIHRVVTDQITAVEAYDGLLQSHPAGHESDPG
jgi:glycerol-3-phosphate dehydrogenase (NAD(P)+)